MYVYLMLHEGSSKVEETARRANIATKLGHNSRLLGSAATHSNSQHQSVGEQNPRARLGECPLVICRTSIWYGGQPIDVLFSDAYAYWRSSETVLSPRLNAAPPQRRHCYETGNQRRAQQFHTARVDD